MPWFLSWERTGSIYWPLKISWALGMRRSVESRRSNSPISKHDLACETKPDCLRGPPWCLKEQVYCHLQMCLSRYEEISFSCLSSNILRLQNRRNEGNKIEQKDCTQKFTLYIYIYLKKEQGMDSYALNSFGFMQLKSILRNSLENFWSLWV